jgi:hypothetical protein
MTAMNLVTVDEWLRRYSLFPVEAPAEVWCEYPVAKMVEMVKDHVSGLDLRCSGAKAVALANTIPLPTEKGFDVGLPMKGVLVERAMLICATWLNAELERVSEKRKMTSYDALCQKMGLISTEDADIQFLDLVLFMVDQVSHDLRRYLISSLVRKTEHHHSMPLESFFLRATTFGYIFNNRSQFVDYHTEKSWLLHKLPLISESRYLPWKRDLSISGKPVH